jgi:N-glycosylase/DNA lyase
MPIITNITDFSPAQIFSCGQCFRFTQINDGVYQGVAFGKELTLTAVPEGIALNCTQKDFENIWYDYFDLGLDYEKVREQINIGGIMTDAIEFGRGIRILKQDFWEALCSFIISQCNNIPRIQGIIKRLCIAYGEDISGAKGQRIRQNTYPFPAPQVIAALSEKDLRALGTGYRAEYILNAARAVADGVLSEEILSKMSFDEAKRELLKIHGIGDKVANCVMLYGLHRLDAFPIDVWMKRALEAYFPPDFDPSVFGEYAGIAQQYIFHYTRMRGFS